MTNEELNTALYEKMFAEQEKYREWLLTQSSEEILNHTYEYTMLRSPSPLADVFADWENKETGYMEDIWQTVEDRAKAEAAKKPLQQSKSTPER